MKKLILTLLLTIFLIPVVNASEEKICDIGFDFDEIILPDSEIVDGSEVNYYCEFKNQNRALANLYDNYQNIFDYIEQNYQLDTLSNNNWIKYYSIVNNNNLPFDSYDIFEIRAFFDIYENKDENEKIRASINKYNIGVIEKKALYSLLPNFQASSELQYSIVPFATQRFNINTGVSYAEKYAWSANTSKYGTLNPDDANFASQILNAGGYTQTSQQAYGWWCQSIGYITNCSDSWKNANAFVNYFGLKNGYQRNFQIFSQNVNRGDFIAIDITGDGNYDRIGFVTYKSNNLKEYTISKNGNTTTAIFNDFIIAQHSNNYNSWVSEDVNDWEYGILTKAKYAILNINKF